jgi:HEPN domain-containing protein
MSEDNNYLEWIRLAEMDMATARHMYETYRPTPLEVVCFHSQQAAEKMLKCYLASTNNTILKTHDMQVLCEMCVELDNSFNCIYESSVMLTRYSVIPRYPAEWGIIADDARKAIEDAEIVMAFVKLLLSESKRGENKEK